MTAESQPSGDSAHRHLQNSRREQQEFMRIKRDLAEKIHAHRRRVAEWTIEQARIAPPPFYSSIDLRDSGYKIAPVDSNLYPAGFNNICPDDLRTAPSIARAQFDAIAARSGIDAVKKLVIIPEAHTSNSYYIENLYYLKGILEESGIEVRLGWYGHAPSENLTREGAVRLVSATGKELEAHSIDVRGGRLHAGGFEPDLVLLNNDFSSGYPTLLDEVEQPVLPSHRLGWHTRKKTEHFRHYNRLAREFAALAGIDPWILHIDTAEVDHVNFNEDLGIDQVRAETAAMLERLRAEHRDRGIEREPFVFVKNNSGTYGMGIMVVHDPKELETLNRRAKNKMSVGKNRLPIQSMAIQEGIPTSTLVDRLAAEPVIYLMGCELIGGFLRTNTERGIEENLNSQGMVFRKLCMSDLREAEISEEEGHPSVTSTDDLPVLELVYGSIARISSLATGLEILEGNRPAEGSAK